MTRPGNLISGGQGSGKRSGPATLFLRWKFEEKDLRRKGKNEEEGERERGKKKRRRGGGGGGVLARKLGAAVWRIQYSPDVARGGGGGGDGGGGGVSRVGLKVGVGEGGNRLSCHHEKKECDAEAKDPADSPCSVNGPINGYHYKAEPSFQFSNDATQ
ncbi:hypothetical protein AKJ16_DCAP26488 [Drosera capensis]